MPMFKEEKEKIKEKIKIDEMHKDLGDSINTILNKHNNVKENILEFLQQFNLSLPDLKHFVLHPGGAKVLDEYEKALGLQNGSIKHSRKVLKEHGNMSSPTVLYVLKEFMYNESYNEGEYGLISALGPGFSSELVLLGL